jgi:hypothetical protein
MSAISNTRWRSQLSLAKTLPKTSLSSSAVRMLMSGFMPARSDEHGEVVFADHRCASASRTAWSNARSWAAAEWRP